MKREDQVGGDHYKCLKMQPLDIIDALYGHLGTEAALMNLVLKYLMRRKGDRQLDLDKAIDCIERLKELEANR